MGSKVTLHCQGIPNHVGAFLDSSGATHLKCIGNYYKHPGVVLIGRVYVSQSKVDGYVAAGASGADGIWAEVKAEVTKNGQVDVWETPANEASFWLSSVFNGYVAFNQRLIGHFHSAGKKIVVGAVNTGWPRKPAEDGGVQIHMLADACQGADGISFHEYAARDMVSEGDGGAILRYRYFHDWCVNHGYSHPPVYITECGIDRGGCSDCGWLSGTTIGGNVDEYVRQLTWYEAQLQADSYVVCATIFTAGNSGWPSFETTASLCEKLGPALAAVEPGPPPEPEPELPPLPEPAPVADMAKGFYVSEYQSVKDDETGDWVHVDLQAAWDAGYRYIFVRTSSGKHADPTFEHYWDAAGEIGFLRAPWHYLHATETGQAAFAAGVLGGRRGEIPVMGVDLEGITTKEKADQWFSAFARNFPGLHQLYYTSKSWADRNGGSLADWYGYGFLLWVADWSQYPPRLPGGVPEWAFHQWREAIPAGGPFPRPWLPDRFVGTEEQLYEWLDLEPPDDGEEVPVGVKITDKYGTVQDWAWLQGRYGDVAISPISGEGYRVTQMYEVEGPMIFTYTVLNQGGGPVVGQQVKYFSDTYSQIEITNGSGVAEHTAGAGEGYDPANGPGPISWQIVGEPGEVISGLGWLWLTEHAHMQIIAQWSGEEQPQEPPEAPTDLVVAAVSDDEVHLEWVDNADDELGFRIERCTGAGCTGFVAVATRGANVTSYQGIGLDPSTTYRYRVRAYNDAGNSAYSNEVEATTKEKEPGGECDLTPVLEKLDEMDVALAALDVKLNQILDRLEGPWTVTAV